MDFQSVLTNIMILLHDLEGQPGSSARFIRKFERYKFDSAKITLWFVTFPGRLGSLLASDNQKGTGWYFY